VRLRLYTSSIPDPLLCEGVTINLTLGSVAITKPEEEEGELGEGG
jgi:hypothetical protein